MVSSSRALTWSLLLSMVLGAQIYEEAAKCHLKNIGQAWQ
jgi:hypothetical protein